MSKWRYFVSKKKSYMNIDNILSEGILDTILRAFIPKDIQDKTNKAYIKIKEKELQKLKKQKKEVDKELENVLIDLEKKLEKRFPGKYKAQIRKKVEQ